MSDSLVDLIRRVLHLERRVNRLESLETPIIGGGGPGAPNDAQYVTLALDAGLTNERVLTEGADIDLVDTGANGTITVGRGGDTILLFHSDGSPIEEFGPNEPGLLLAIAAAVDSGDIIEGPAATITLTASITVPASVTLRNANLSFSAFAGNAVVLNDSSQLIDCVITYNGAGQANATAVYAVGLNSTSITHCTIHAQNAIGTNRGLYAEGLSLVSPVTIHDSYIQGTGGTLAIGAQIGNAVVVDDCGFGATGAVAAPNIGVYFTCLNSALMPFMQGGYSIAKEIPGSCYAVEVAANSYGKVTSAYLEALTSALYVPATATLYVSDCTRIGGETVAGTLTYLDAIYFNVKDFGAIGNGAADDTAAIQSAINAAHVTGGVAWFPAGTYMVSALTAYADVTLAGAGINVTIVKSNAASVMFNYGVPGAIALTMPIRDMTLDGNSTGTIGIDLAGAFYFTMDHVAIIHFTSYAARFRAVLCSHINYCVIDGNANGIYDRSFAIGGSTIQSNLVRINDTVISSNTGLGIDWAGGSTLILNSVDMEANGTVANAATGAVRFVPEDEGLGLVVQNSWFEYNNGGADIWIDTPVAAGQYSSISNSLFVEDGDTTYVVYVEGAVRQNNLVSHNVQVYSHAATADWFANGASSLISLYHCTGSTGGAGTINSYPPYGGGGTVTSVTAGTGLTAVPNPIVGIGTISITDTTVVAGAYTSANITVNAQGQLTAASNGFGSGEVLMADGVTPPDPLLTIAEDDWLYEG